MVAQRTPKSTRIARQTTSQSPQREISSSLSPRVTVTYAGRKRTPSGAITRRSSNRSASVKRRLRRSPDSDSDYIPSDAEPAPSARSSLTSLTSLSSLSSLTSLSDSDDDEPPFKVHTRLMTREAEVKEALEKVNAELVEAQQSLQSVKDEVQVLRGGEESPYMCNTCLDYLSQPYSLACGHSFCVNCLNKLAIIFSNSKKNLSCPECRAIQGFFTPIPNFTMQSQVEAFMRARSIACPEREKLVWPEVFQSKPPTEFPFPHARGTYPINPSLQVAPALPQSVQPPPPGPAPAPFPVSIFDDF
ncbi:hypothetical protein EV360DRAFT_88330 [Lentinula raphanica]|nr:hypothetical protein EV360DRAFT_88330 [Lentinula raphanica]